MNKIVKTNQAGGFPLYNDDIRFIQEEEIENLESNLSSIVQGVYIFSGSGYIVSGSHITVFSGVISYGNKLYPTSNYLSQTGDINNVWVVDDTTYDASGDRTFKNGTAVSDIYEINRCKYVYDTGTPSGYAWAKKLVEFPPLIKQLAEVITNPVYVDYEIYKTWIDKLFDDDAKSQYAFDKLLENNTRTEYNINKLLINQILREYFMDHMISNSSDSDYFANLIKDSLVEEFTGFTFVNSYNSSYGTQLTLTKDNNGFIHIFGIVKANGSDSAQFISSLPAAYTPTNTADGTATEVRSGSGHIWNVRVTNTGDIRFYSSPSGNTSTTYSIDIKYKV